ncbi:hypothetical protein K443DRAFT_105811 [Laccaria amethystina LaAM-08-1]|uniref:Unplaced genomic scaffold K443scaffold_160, whole genome shotgun sequence n=1 Tax=Laccaria amethystina LaAM-08-1 TaxID=1095629 RepID=A0A0C9XMS3_9AGAR|nr:hypothetical protein K443DRAFT_105811 [Laccaria amethystina LaAM-08-1]
MKVGFVPTWCISGFGLSRVGFGLAEVRCVHNSVPLVRSCYSTIRRPSSSRLLLFSPVTIEFVRFRALLTLPPSFDYSSTAPAHHDSQVPFHIQNNQSPHHIRPKSSWVLVYPGVESSSFTGAWAGRCVITHLDDCWGLFRRSRASSHR